MMKTISLAWLVWIGTTIGFNAFAGPSEFASLLNMPSRVMIIIEDSGGAADFAAYAENLVKKSLTQAGADVVDPELMRKVKENKLLMKAIENANATAMARIANPDKLPTFVKLAVDPKDPADRSAAERAVVIMFAKTPDKKAQAAPVLAELKSAPNDAKPVLLSLLTRPATPEALAAVRAAVRSSDSKVSAAAFRAMGDWPNAAPAPELYKVASTSSDPVQRIVALRSYIRPRSIPCQ